MTSPQPPQTQRPRETPKAPPAYGTQGQDNLHPSSIFGPGNPTQNGKMIHVTERQHTAGWHPVVQEFNGPSTNFIFSQPGSYNITMGHGQGPPAYQQEYPYAVAARPYPKP